MYISQKFSNRPQKDIQIYSLKEIEYVFIEFFIPNKLNKMSFIYFSYLFVTFFHWERDNYFLT